MKKRELRLHSWQTAWRISDAWKIPQELFKPADWQKQEQISRRYQPPGASQTVSTPRHHGSDGPRADNWKFYRTFFRAGWNVEYLLFQYNATRIRIMGVPLHPYHRGKELAHTTKIFPRGFSRKASHCSFCPNGWLRELCPFVENTRYERLIPHPPASHGVAPSCRRPSCGWIRMSYCMFYHRLGGTLYWIPPMYFCYWLGLSLSTGVYTIP